MPDSKVEVKAVPVYVEEALCKWFSEAPCFLCGYNGEGYYQPNAHSCAKHYHSMTLSKLWNTRPIANNGVSLEEFRMHVLNVLKKRFPHVGEKSYENIKDAQDEILVKLQPTAPRGGGEEICICSAVKTEDGDIIKGHRHHDCFRAIESRNKKILKEQGAQGFITSHGRYVDRKEGCSLMRLAGRKSRAGFEFKEDDILTSEDLY